MMNKLEATEKKLGQVTPRKQPKKDDKKAQIQAAQKKVQIAKNEEFEIEGDDSDDDDDDIDDMLAEEDDDDDDDDGEEQTLSSLVAQVRKASGDSKESSSQKIKNRQPTPGAAQIKKDGGKPGQQQ